MLYKFKGQRLDNGEWVEGNLVSYFKSADKKEVGSFILESSTVSFVDLKKNVFCSTDCYEVDPNSVQLLEKDKPKSTQKDDAAEKAKYAINFFKKRLKEDKLKYGERQAIYIALDALRKDLKGE